MRKAGDKDVSGNKAFHFDSDLICSERRLSHAASPSWHEGFSRCWKTGASADNMAAPSSPPCPGEDKLIYLNCRDGSFALTHRRSVQAVAVTPSVAHRHPAVGQTGSLRSSLSVFLLALVSFPELRRACEKKKWRSCSKLILNMINTVS